MYYVMIRVKPTRSIKIINRSIMPAESKGYVIAWTGPDMVEAYEAKLELRRLCKDVDKAKARWKRMGQRLMLAPCAPAFSAYMSKIKEEWANSEPQTPTKVLSRPMAEAAS